MDAYADAVEPMHNDRGGCVRAGTGSAMFYLWYADHVGNALSGHRKGESFSANYAPELFVRSKGPLSVIRFFTKPHLKRTINGGPLTMEFHSSIFRDADSVPKTGLCAEWRTPAAAELGKPGYHAGRPETPGAVPEPDCPHLGLECLLHRAG